MVRVLTSGKRYGLLNPSTSLQWLVRLETALAHKSEAKPTTATEVMLNQKRFEEAFKGYQEKLYEKLLYDFAIGQLLDAILEKQAAEDDG